MAQWQAIAICPAPLEPSSRQLAGARLIEPALRVVRVWRLSPLVALAVVFVASTSNSNRRRSKDF